MIKWYETDNTDNVAISTRIRLARNLKSLPFGHKMSASQQQELLDRVTEALKLANLGNNKLEFIKLDDLDDKSRYSLVERHLASPNFVEGPTNKLLVVSEDNSISIMVNEEDHLRIQVLANGMELENSYKLCSMIDDLLDEQLDYAFDEQIGYLTACPTNIGTGLRASIMLHLPAIASSGAIGSLIKTVGRLGLTIRGTYGEGSNVQGSIYQLSNQLTIGLDEETALKNLENVAKQIINRENELRKEMYQGGETVALTDRIMRSLGTLKYAELLASNEFYDLVSNVRLGISLGIINDVDIKSLNILYQKVGDATICLEARKACTPTEIKLIRARTVKDTL